MYEPVVQRGVMPGRRLHLFVEGSASLRLTVLDGQGGPILERYGLRMHWGGPIRIVRGDGRRAPADGRVEGVVPLPLELEVRPPGRAPLRVRVDDLEPGEEAELTVVVPKEDHLP